MNLNCFYGSHQVLRNLNIEVLKNEILGIIGPANSGKTTFLRALNRLEFSEYRIIARRARSFLNEAKSPRY